MQCRGFGDLVEWCKVKIVLWARVNQTFHVKLGIATDSLFLVFCVD